MASNISVTWETVCDGKTREGSNLHHNLEDLITAGYSVDVETPDGTRTFTDADAFGEWFTSLGAMLTAWKYSFNGHYLILARKGDFTGVPPEIVSAVSEAQPVEWGDKPGEPVDGAVGMSRQEIEHALQSKGYIYTPPLRR